MFTRIQLISASSSALSAVVPTALATALMALISVVPPALAASGPAFTVTGPTQKVLPEGSGPSGASSAQLLGARNEFVSFQVVIPGGPAGAKNVRLAPGKALTGVGGTIPATNVTIYREEYYTTQQASIGDRPVGRWPDALIPSVDPLYNEVRKAFPIDVLADENRVAWVDVLVPKAQRAGFYDGDLVLSSSDGQSVIPVHLDVRNLTLPSTSSLKSLFRIHAQFPCAATHPGCSDNPDSSTKGWSTNYDYARLALDNRITIANSQFQAPEVQPVNNHPVIDNFKKYQLPLINGTAKTRLPGARTTTFSVVTAESSQAWKQQAVEGGFTDRSVLYTFKCDEPGNNEEKPVKESKKKWSECKDEVDQAHRDANWPGLPNVVTASIQDVDKADAGKYTDVIAPVIDAMHGKFDVDWWPYYGNQRGKYNNFLDTPGKQLWMYTSCDAAGCVEPNPANWDGWVDYTIDAAASQNRAMGWLAYQYDVSGELYYAVDQNLKTAWTHQWEAGGNGDGTLFYPWDKNVVGGATPIPIESMRMKLIRNGHQDYEYLKLASAAGHKAEVDQIAKQLYPSNYDTIATDAEVDAAKRKLAQLAEPGRVTAVGSLSVTPTARSEPNSMTASFTVTNDGGAPMTIDYLLTGVRDSAGRNVDFPSTGPLTLQPGQQYTYRVPKTFAAGTYTAWAAYYDGKEWPRLSQQVSFTVS